MSLTIKSEISKQFLLEEDAVLGFKKAVDNNQLRLAMQVLTEIVDAFMEAFEVVLEQDDSVAVEEQVVVEEKVEEQKEVKKTTTKKSETKEEKE